MLLEPPASAIRTACVHCGSPLPDARSRDSGFCCAGCAYVHRLIAENGWGEYYRLKDTVVPPADPGVFQPPDYQWLAAQQAGAEATAGPGWARLDLQVQGISCAACIWLIERMTRETPGVREVAADAANGTLQLAWAKGEFDGAAWAARLHSLGYLLGPAGAELPPAGAGAGRRIGLCVACALNVMLFTLPRYFGMRDDFPYAPLFGSLSLLFATLSVLIGGTYFAAKAAAALRLGRMHLDLPIAIGILGAYGGSLAGWLAGDSRFVYFDFVATFTALMLVGRWAQTAALERNRRRLLRHQPLAAEVQLATGASVSREALREGDCFRIAPGQAVPVDARLEAPQAMYSLASISGEASPRLYRSGALVPAGAVSVDRSGSLLRAAQGWEDSLLCHLLRTRGRLEVRGSLVERVVQGYVAGILVLSAATALGWGLATRDWVKAGSAAIAVLVVSCPCAIGLALPFAEELAMAAARLRGVFVKETDLWSRLDGVDRIVFDKTGTLTLEAPVLTNPEELLRLSPEERAALGAMVQRSLHPVSQSLWENLLVAGFGERTDLPVREFPGQGLSLGHWTLGRAGWADPGNTSSETILARCGQPVARFRFAESARPNARAQVARLQKNGYRVAILSGDHPAKVRLIAAQLGIPADCALGGLTPAEKADWIRAHGSERALMLGDGLNDALAFEAAACRGTPVVHRNQLEGRADFYYLRGGIEGVGDLLEIAKARRRTQAMIVGFSVLYNAAASGCAAAGLITPLLAAVLMPMSSVVSLALAGLGMRAQLRPPRG